MNRKVELIEFDTHPKVTFYTFRFTDAKDTEFDKFLDNFDNTNYTEDIDIILGWIEKIGTIGALERNFRPEIENMVALPMQESKLRLYAFRINDGLVIIGNGGKKKTRTFNEDPVLSEHAYNILSIGKILNSMIRKGTITVYQNKLYELKPIKFNPYEAKSTPGNEK